MIEVAGGLGAACAWAVASLLSSRSSRVMAPSSVLAWVMLCGLAVNLPIAFGRGIPSITGAQGAWLAVAGAGNAVGLLVEYHGFRVGKVGVVTALASTEGAIAAVIAAVAGEPIGVGVGAALVVITIGIVLAGLVRDGGSARMGQAVVHGLTAAVLFGFGIYAAGHIGSELPVGWVLLSTRAVGVALVTIPLALTRRLELTRRALPLVAAAGVLEVTGFAFYILGARHGIAVTAVLASQFAALAAVLAYVLFRERLTSLQAGGIATIAAGVAAVAALQA